MLYYKKIDQSINRIKQRIGSRDTVIYILSLRERQCYRALQKELFLQTIIMVQSYIFMEKDIMNFMNLNLTLIHTQKSLLKGVIDINVKYKQESF